MTTSNDQRTPAVILLVEDNPGDQLLTKRAFEDGRLRNELRVVSDGEEALNYLFRRGEYEDPASSPIPDLILLDLNMPKVDGRQVLAEIKKDPVLRRIAVVVLTTSSQEEDVLRSYQIGASSYISKPVDMIKFVEVVKSLEEYWFEVVRLPPNGH